MNTNTRQPLTARQREVLAFIKSHIKGHGYPPTIQDIADQFGIASKNGVMCHIYAMEKKGWISRDPMKSRSMRVL